jgi:hypothetical protein
MSQDIKSDSNQGPNGIYNSGSQWIPYYNKEKPESKLTKVLWGVEVSSAKEMLTT